MRTSCAARTPRSAHASPGEVRDVDSQWEAGEQVTFDGALDGGSQTSTTQISTSYHTMYIAT